MLVINPLVSDEAAKLTEGAVTVAEAELLASGSFK